MDKVLKKDGNGYANNIIEYKNDVIVSFYSNIMEMVQRLGKDYDECVRMVYEQPTEHKLNGSYFKVSDWYLSEFESISNEIINPLVLDDIIEYQKEEEEKERVDETADFEYEYKESDNVKLLEDIKTLVNNVQVKKRANPKVLIIGHGRHGKDTLAEIFQEHFGLKFMASSQAASDIFIYDELKDVYGYESSLECFEDRSNHRAEWYRMICNYNKNDKARLAKDILSINDCYVGMRDEPEIQECLNQGLFDLIIWVDASERHPQESAESFNIKKSVADVVVYNNGTLEEFTKKAINLGKIIYG